MRILFLSPVLPHAEVISGPIIVHNRIKLLAERGYEIGLASFVGAGDEAHAADLKPMLFEMELLPLPARRRMPSVTDYLGLGAPAPFRAVWSPAMQRRVGDMVTRSRYDVVIAEFSAMGQFLNGNPYLPATRRIISCHSCLTTACQKAIDLQRWSAGLLKKYLALKNIEKHEFATYRSADLVLALNHQERMDLLHYEPNLNIAVVPYGVDVDHFRPNPAEAAEEALVFTGYYADDANRDAAMWFARAVWPRLKARHPNLRFYIVGRAPSADMKDLARRDRQVIVTGEVPDVAPYLTRSRIYVCPMRMGTGFRGKVLQAMAAGVPVVATTLAAEGIPAQVGENIMLADTPHVMEESIHLLLSDAGLRRTLATNARDLAVRRFSWAHCVDLLEGAIREIVS